MQGFHLLVLEDSPRMAEQVVKLFQDVLPGSNIELALSVDEAVERINARLLVGVPYDLALLDFRLPLRTGEHDDFDESICQLLTEVMPSTIIGHLTAYAGDERIVEHVRRVHTPGRPQGFFLDKRKDVPQLVPRTLQALYSSRIEREIGELFPSLEGRYP
jgi:CheY-like chemotaxis protein